MNFVHFLNNGIQCATQDTIIVVTPSVQQHYQEQIDELHSTCWTHYQTKVRMIVRNNTCFDLESVRRVTQDTIDSTTTNGVLTEDELTSYDYFIFVNCGTSGPSAQWAQVPWTKILWEPMQHNPTIKMTGLTMNCPTMSYVIVGVLVFYSPNQSFFSFLVSLFGTPHHILSLSLSCYQW